MDLQGTKGVTLIVPTGQNTARIDLDPSILSAIAKAGTSTGTIGQRGPPGPNGSPAPVQILSSIDADPTAASIMPGDKSRVALFFQDPSITISNWWLWSVVNQAWVQIMAP